ncbi:MAG TPA: hypothetical protein VF269_09645 [Rhodanobacteraceae bacterium]
MSKWRIRQIVTCVLLVAGLSWLVVATSSAGGRPLPAMASTVAVKAAAITVINAAPGLTLEQAVAEVQKKTRGKVLRAGTRQYGDATEYRIKVLTPDGHVRVIPVRSRPVHTASRHSKHSSKEIH